MLQRPEDIMQMTSQYWAISTLFAAVELEIFDVVRDDAVSCDDLAKQIDCDAPSLARLLHAVTALGLLHKNGETYRTTELSRQHLCRDAKQYLGDIIQHHRHLAPSWLRLEEAVKTGAPVRKSSAARTEADRRSFLMGMFNMGTMFGPRIAANLDLSSCSRLLDLGGGPAAYSIAFCNANPQLHATVFDLPTTQPFADKTIADADLQDRIDFVPGDFVQDPLPSDNDAVWASHVLHGEGPENAAKVVKKAAGALRDGGLLIIHEFIVNDDESGPLFPTLFSLNMLQGTHGGKAYAQGELRQMMVDADLTRVQFVPLPGNSDIIMGKK